MRFVGGLLPALPLLAAGIDLLVDLLLRRVAPLFVDQLLAAGLVLVIAHGSPFKEKAPAAGAFGLQNRVGLGAFGAGLPRRAPAHAAAGLFTLGTAALFLFLTFLAALFGLPLRHVPLLPSRWTQLSARFAL